jgi:hypothetical protein
MFAVVMASYIYIYRNIVVLKLKWGKEINQKNKFIFVLFFGFDDLGFLRQKRSK